VAITVQKTVFVDSMSILFFLPEVLKYHVIPGARRASQLSDGQSLFTLHGTAVNVTINARGTFSQENNTASLINEQFCECTKSQTYISIVK